MFAKCHSRYFINLVGHIFSARILICTYCVHGAMPSLCLRITLSDPHTGTRMLTHTHICTAHGHRQAYTCWRICNYNQINWSISPWKHHIYTWRPLVAFSWMLLTLTRSRAAGAGSAGSQPALWHQHLFMAYMLEKLLQHLQPHSVWQRRNFYLFLWRIPTYLSCTFFWLNLTRRNINMKVSVAWQKPWPLQRQWQNTLGLCNEYHKYINHNPY